MEDPTEAVSPASFLAARRLEQRIVPSISRSFWSGIGGGITFVVVQLAARVTAQLPTLPEIVQDRLVLSLPGPVFAFFLDRLLYLGKPLLFVSLLCGLILLGGLFGIALGRWGRALSISLLLWLVIGLLLLPLVSPGPFGGSAAVALAELLSFVAYALAFIGFAGLPLRCLVLPAPATAGAVERPRGSAATTVDRRRLLAGGVLGIAAAGLTWRAIGRLPELPPRSGGSVPTGGAAGELPASPLASAADSPAPGLPPAITPSDRFYIVSKNLLDPHVDANRWKLRIDGMVDRPLTIVYGDLLEMPAVSDYRTLECVSNTIGGDLISNGRWTGVRLADLLQRAGVRQGAAAVQFGSADGYTSDLSLPQALDPATLLVYRLDDQPLALKHGFPARILTPATYGMKDPKWVTHIQVVRAAKPGFWQQQGWDEHGIVQTMATVNSPADGAQVSAGSVNVAGIAFAGARGIQRVEVSTDGGSTWLEARLLPSLGANTWTFWQYAWQPPAPGAYVISARATDGTGVLQTSRRTDPFPVGATGLQQVRVRVLA